ncbi:MAG: hypothetical protein FWH41_01635 [Treponema sp.]|nr:hypothetical protein [Treponema sp.]
MGIKEYAGRIGKVINHHIEKAVELIAETRKGYNQKGILFNSSGEDSPPIKNDKLALLKIDGTGKYAVVGIFNETQGAKPGEKIFFARDENGNIKSKLSMLGNGTIEVEGKELLLNGEGEKAARNGDSVKIKIPANTFIVSVSGGSGTPAVGVLNPSDMEFEGVITSGSSSVIIGD